MPRIYQGIGSDGKGKHRESNGIIQVKSITPMINNKMYHDIKISPHRPPVDRSDIENVLLSSFWGSAVESFDFALYAACAGRGKNHDKKTLLLILVI